MVNLSPKTTWRTGETRMLAQRENENVEIVPRNEDGRKIIVALVCYILNLNGFDKT